MDNASNIESPGFGTTFMFDNKPPINSIIINGDEEQYYPVAIRDIADVSGAGDTVIAVASLAMAAGLPPKIIAQMSNLAGGLVCEKVGVVPVDQTQLKKEMKSQKI